MTGGLRIPPEHREIARGSGAAAILMFLHIGASGYLGFMAYYLMRHGMEVAWTFVRPQAVFLYWLPVFFVVLTMLPTDKLTYTVGLVARLIGGFVLLLCGVFAAVGVMQEAEGLMGRWLRASLMCFGGMGGALVLRAIFMGLMVDARENYKKSGSGNEVVE